MRGMNSRNKLIAVCVICAAVALLSVGGVVFAYQKYASTFNNASNGNVSLNSINEGMSYTILDDGMKIPIKVRQCLCRQKQMKR